MSDVLAVLDDSGPEFGGGLSNHGPMAAEALFVLGRGESAVSWAERYRARLQDAPRPGASAIDPAAWREALGDYSRLADWEAFFAREVDVLGWQRAVGTWVPRLLPGLITAATHGAIRTAHAARSLGTGVDGLRLRELARGLAYWAARYHVLPGDPTQDGDADLDTALRSVPYLPAEKRRGWLITDRLHELAGWSPFGPVVGALGATDDPGARLSSLTRAMAGFYLANADLAPIAFVHSVTGPSALRLLAPYVRPADVRTAERYAWQAAAALLAAYGEHREVPGLAVPVDPADTVSKVVASGDEHAIKFTEACLREHALAPDPVYLAAADDYASRALASDGQ
jgi:hypothetical protein